MSTGQPALPKVTNIVSKDISPVVPGFEKYLLTTLFPEHFSFELHNANNAISNGLRRMLCGELPALALWFESEDFSTDNPFSVIGMIRNRLRLIPISQAISTDAIFSLDVANDTATVKYFHTNDLRQISGAKLSGGFCNNQPLFTLEPGKFLRINRITVRRDYGYNFAGHSLVCNAVSLALDQAPPLEYRDEIIGNISLSEVESGAVADIKFEEEVEAKAERVPSRLARPTKWRIAFNTNGQMPAKSMVVAACDELIEYMQTVNKYVPTIEREGALYVLVIPGHSYTTANLLTRTITDLLPATATHSVDDMSRVLRVRVLTDDNVSDIIQRATAIITDQYRAIRKAFV